MPRYMIEREIPEIGSSDRDALRDASSQSNGVLSAMQADGKLIILDDAELKEGKTKSLAVKFAKLNWGRVLIVGGSPITENFVRAARNIPNVDVLPTEGANVYDILRRDTLVLTKGAVEGLGARLL